MKTTEQTDNTHEQPIQVLNHPSRQKAQMTSETYGRCFYFVVAMYLFSGVAVWRVKVLELIKVGGLEMVIGLVISVILVLAGIMFLAMGVAAGNVYFYDRYVEIRRFLPFMKRHVMYYDKMHAHVSVTDNILLNHYETRPKFWKSPSTWLKANIFYIVYIPNFYDSEIQEFVKTKALSVSHYSLMGHKLN